jgi:hypothetical protein
MLLNRQVCRALLEDVWNLIIYQRSAVAVLLQSQIIDNLKNIIEKGRIFQSSDWGLRWRGPAATVNYTPVLSSERVLQNNKQANL